MILLKALCQHLEGLQKTMIKCQASQSLSRYFQLGPTEYEAEVIITVTMFRSLVVSQKAENFLIC